MRALKVSLSVIAALAVLLCGTSALQASQAYSFETLAGAPPGPDGFFGLSAAVSQDVLGVTDGSYSMKYLAGAAGFVGARTETVIPAALNNPPGVQSVLFDMMVPAVPGGLTWADIGITIFGHDIDNGIYGVQNQFTDTLSIVGLGAGQHLNLKIDLDTEFFSGDSFDEIFGSDVTDLDVASGFQFYISKTGGVSVTVYIDNVRLVVPEPATGLLMGLAAVGGVLVRRRSR